MQLLVILVPVVFALMGFAVDLGRLYMNRAELQAAANAMALAAAQRLIGTDASTGYAATAAQEALANTSGIGNKYDFGALVIGQTNGFLSSTAQEPAFFGTAAEATGTGEGGGAVTGAAAKYARINLTAEGPLLFWGFLSVGQERKATLAAQAVAGVSAPLCTVCGIEPLAVAAVDSTDPTDFGFVPGTRYTFIFQCTGNPLPSALANAGSRINYLLLNRYDTDATVLADESTQLFRDGAQGLPGNSSQAKACFSVNGQEQIWASAVPVACSSNSVPNPVVNYMCGMYSRFDSTVPTECATIPEVDTVSSAYRPDTDITDLDDYTTYSGSGRRVMTIPIVDALAVGGTMTVLGFRQFLIEPNPNDINVSPSDPWGRFVGLYIGSAMPVRQGRFDSCGITAGPGKVVLHR